MYLLEVLCPSLNLVEDFNTTHHIETIIPHALQDGDADNTQPFPHLENTTTFTTKPISIFGINPNTTASHESKEESEEKSPKRKKSSRRK